MLNTEDKTPILFIVIVFSPSHSDLLFVNQYIKEWFTQLLLSNNEYFWGYAKKLKMSSISNVWWRKCRNILQAVKFMRSSKSHQFLKKLPNLQELVNAFLNVAISSWASWFLSNMRHFLYWGRWQITSFSVLSFVLPKNISIKDFRLEWKVVESVNWRDSFRCGWSMWGWLRSETFDLILIWFESYTSAYLIFPTTFF